MRKPSCKVRLGLATETSAPGMTAPPGSEIAPRSVPVPSWAIMLNAHKNNKSKEKATLKVSENRDCLNILDSFYPFNNKNKTVEQFINAVFKIYFVGMIIGKELYTIKSVCKEF